MPQLVGRNCVICSEQISSALDAEFCESCGNSVHGRCRKEYRAEDGADATRCARCGGNTGTAPERKTTATFPSPEFWMYGLSAVAMLAVVVVLTSVAFTLRPSADSPKNADVADASRQEIQNQGVENNPIIEIETTLGTIRAELFQDRAPKTVENFVDLVNQEFYDGIIFHRVIDEFMIQTGDPLGTGTGGRTDKGLPGKHLADEFHPDLRHDKPGVLSMANSGPNTGDTQFFITTVPTSWLDDKHSIFGQVIEGMDVVRKIEKVKTGEGDRPLDEVKMVRVRLAATEH